MKGPQNSKSIHVHFVCTGNTYRSRLAEAYLRAKKLPHVRVSSSGILARENRSGPITWYAARIIKNLSLVPFMTPNWTQTNADTLSGADIVIFMTEAHREHCRERFGLTDVPYEVWQIPDLNELGFTTGYTTPEEELRRIEASEKTFKLITNKVDNSSKSCHTNLLGR